jgi:hypothetical protein
MKNHDGSRIARKRNMIKELPNVQKNLNKLRSLYIELDRHEQFNPYKTNTITDMPKGSGGAMNFCEWYVEEKERIEIDIELYKNKIQEDRKAADSIIKQAPPLVSEIIQYRVINGLGWQEIGALMNMDRTTVSKKFYKYFRTKY